MCVADSRRAQLRPYVAPPALLFVTGRAVAAPAVDLSPANRLRIAGTTAIILVLAIIATVVVGLRLVRPLRLLTVAARQPVDRQGPVPVTTRDEIGYLATALNDLAARREALEQQRKAMVGDIAHELRTPLTNIRTWLETAPATATSSWTPTSSTCSWRRPGGFFFFFFFFFFFSLFFFFFFFFGDVYAGLLGSRIARSSTTWCSRSSWPPPRAGR